MKLAMDLLIQKEPYLLINLHEMQSWNQQMHWAYVLRWLEVRTGKIIFKGEKYFKYLTGSFFILEIVWKFSLISVSYEI